MILLSRLRAERDKIEEDLILWHFDRDRDQEDFDHLAKQDDYSLSSRERLKSRLVENEKWEALIEFEKLVEITKKIAHWERKDAESLIACGRFAA